VNQANVSRFTYCEKYHNEQYQGQDEEIEAGIEDAQESSE
jgi:hypothetical protein